MKPIQNILTFLTAAVLFCSPVMAAPNFDTANLAGRLKDLVKQEGRNKMMEYGKEYMELANNFIALTETLKQTLEMPDLTSTTDLKEWAPIVPKNVAPLLVMSDPVKGDEPDLDKVQEEVAKVVYLNPETNDTLRRSREQQNALFLKTLAFAYASANRSLELSNASLEQTDEMRKQIEKTKDALGLYGQMVKLQMFSSRKLYETLHLQTRSLEVNSAMGLINKEKPVDVSDITTSSDGSSDTGTDSSGGETTQTPAPSGSTPAAGQTK